MKIGVLQKENYMVTKIIFHFRKIEQKINKKFAHF